MFAVDVQRRLSVQFGYQYHHIVSETKHLTIFEYFNHSTVITTNYNLYLYASIHAGIAQLGQKINIYTVELEDNLITHTHTLSLSLSLSLCVCVCVCVFHSSCIACIKTTRGIFVFPIHIQYIFVQNSSIGYQC